MTIDELQRWRCLTSNWLQQSIFPLSHFSSCVRVCLCTHAWSHGEVSGVNVWSVFTVIALLHVNVCGSLSEEHDGLLCASKGRPAVKLSLCWCVMKEIMKQPLIGRMWPRSARELWQMLIKDSQCSSVSLHIFILTFIKVLHLSSCCLCSSSY